MCLQCSQVSILPNIYIRVIVGRLHSRSEIFDLDQFAKSGKYTTLFNISTIPALGLKAVLVAVELMLESGNQFNMLAAGAVSAIFSPG